MGEQFYTLIFDKYILKLLHVWKIILLKILYSLKLHKNKLFNLANTELEKIKIL